MNALALITFAVAVIAWACAGPMLDAGRTNTRLTSVSETPPSRGEVVTAVTTFWAEEVSTAVETFGSVAHVS